MASKSEWGISFNPYEDIPAKREDFFDYDAYNEDQLMTELPTELYENSASSSLYRAEPISALSSFQGPSLHATYMGNPPASNTYFYQNIYTFPENSEYLIPFNPNGRHTSYQGPSIYGYGGMYANPSPHPEPSSHLPYTQQCHSRVNPFILPSPGITQPQGMDVDSASLWEPQKYNLGSLTDIDCSLNNPLRAGEIQGLLENIRPDVEICKESREDTPGGLKHALYEHQKLALTWMKQMEEGNNKGGILADDMGLGKTISVLALILSRPSENRQPKTTLIVGPVAVVRQWEREIQTKINTSHKLSTFLYHSGKKASWKKLGDFDIVLTTYGTLSAEYQRLEDWRRQCATDPNLGKNIAKKRFDFLGDDSFWYRVILDEAHCIKNKKTNAALATCHLKALTRFCLTGTPMMNGIHELFSLIRFLRIKPYDDYNNFTSDFGCLVKSRKGDIYPQIGANASTKLKALLKAILLRRTKTSMLDGTPILILPEKTEEIVHAIFSDDEQAYYTALETKTRIEFNRYVGAGTIRNNSNHLALLFRLRQAACHPHLIMDFEEAPLDVSVEDIETWATLHPEVVSRITEATVPFECPVCYDCIANPRIIIPCGQHTCSECLVKIAGNLQQETIAEGNEAGDAKCPTCRGKVDMKKIIDYNTFKKVLLGQKNNRLVEDETQSEDEEKAGHISIAMLKEKATRSKEGYRRYMRYLEENWISSAKISKCLEILRSTEHDIKTIVFSQFTTLLDLLEIPIRKEGWGFTRYDGRMSADARHHSVNKFTDDASCKIILVSLKAGNAGLNLVAASQVIILDPFWNPFTEIQAIDRAHRIGQQKPVKVVRIVVKNTVEDRIIEMQKKKRRLVREALDGNDIEGQGRLDREGLNFLFNGVYIE